MGERPRRRKRQHPCGLTRAKERSTELSRLNIPVRWLSKPRMPFPGNLAACRTLVSKSEKRPQRGQFLPDLPPHSPAMGQRSRCRFSDITNPAYPLRVQKSGEKWAAAGTRLRSGHSCAEAGPGRHVSAAAATRNRPGAPGLRARQAGPLARGRSCLGVRLAANCRRSRWLAAVEEAIGVGFRGAG